MGFQYQPLDAASREIRLLSLAPAAEKEVDIECTLRTVPLNRNLEYEALSYTWGDATDRRVIQLNGYPFSVTKNLEAALRHLRRAIKWRILWIDAICINQDDLEERNKQVPRMNTIYRMAGPIIAWLGDAADDSDLVMDLLKREGYQFEDNPAASTALVKFCSRPYWRRAWVIQELAANPGRTILCCGYKRIHMNPDFIENPFIDLERLGMIAYMSDRMRLNDKLYAAQMHDAVQTCASPYGESWNFASIWLRTRGFLCADPRDAVFAILGVPAVARLDRIAVVPDYTKSLKQILQELTHHLVCTNNDISILSGLRRNKDPLSPSWLPDLSVQNFDSQNWDPYWADRLGISASGSSKPCVSISEDLHFLAVKGFMVDLVDKSIGPASISDLPELKRMLSAMETAVLDIRTRLQSRDPTSWLPKYKDYKEAFRWTVVGPQSRYGLDDNWYKILMDRAQVPADFALSWPQEARKGLYLSIYLRTLTLHDRCFFTTRNGYIGVGPYDVQSGDLVTILFGGKFCYILRKAEEHYKLMGDAYVHGIMKGELLSVHPARKERMLEEQEFVLC